MDAHLFALSFEEGEERCLGSGRAFDTPEADVVPRSLDVSQIPEQLLGVDVYQDSLSKGITNVPRRNSHLQPQGGPLAYGRQLGRLEVGPSQRRQVLVLVGPAGESLDDDRQFRYDDVACVSEEYEVGVVGNVAGRGSEMDDGSGGGTDRSEDVDVGHDVVPAAFLLDGGLLHLLAVEVLYGGMGRQVEGW